MAAQEHFAPTQTYSQANVALLVKNLKAGKKARSVQQGLHGYFAKQKPKQKVIVLNTSITEECPELSQDGWETETDELD